METGGDEIEEQPLPRSSSCTARQRRSSFPDQFNHRTSSGDFRNYLSPKSSLNQQQQQQQHQQQHIRLKNVNNFHGGFSFGSSLASSHLHSLTTTSYSRRNRADSALYFGENSYKITDQLGDTITPEIVDKTNVKQSKRLPYWAWFIIAKCLGIRLHAGDRPWFGTVLFMSTLTFSILHAVTMTWYYVYDIITEWTSTTVITGGVQVCIVCSYCALGVYANHLAFRLFTNKMMLQSVRLHAKTIFKINSSYLVAVLGVVFIAVNLVHNRYEFSAQTCEQVNLNRWICHLRYTSRAAYSCAALFWNLLVAIVILSVCRTHTIGIRRFIKELEEDGRHYCEYSRRIIHNGHSRVDDIMHNFESIDDSNQGNWDEMHYFEQSTQGVPTSQNSSTTTSPSHQMTGSPTPQSPTPHDPLSTQSSPILSQTEVESAVGAAATTVAPPVITIVSETDTRPGSDRLSDTNNSLINLVVPDPPSQISQGSSIDSRINSTKVELGSPRQVPSPDTQEQFSLDDDLDPRVFTCEDILLSYWQINSRLRVTSSCLQRWLASWIAFVTLWSALYIIWWLKNRPSFYDIAEFIIPLLMLPLICSAYAEVNFEANRMIMFICPLENRLQMLRFFNQQPLQLTVFGFALNYAAILSVFVALGLAFATRVIMDVIHA
ncbi:uncharacterized protein LOC141910086 isoform X2 [Tubulanus polymorphus]|uniref:uncharacterized protein LOC141910086 isoform X2 n=1 Tax=Tubulanus polymorphus TaxID=672921 RepID=UPI003DA5C377